MKLEMMMRMFQVRDEDSFVEQTLILFSIFT